MQVSLEVLRKGVSGGLGLSFLQKFEQVHSYLYEDIYSIWLYIDLSCVNLGENFSAFLKIFKSVTCCMK